MEEIGALEKSKTSAATAVSILPGIMGTAFMALSTFAVTAQPPRIALCALAAIPGFIGWGAPYFVYRSIIRWKTAKSLRH